MTITITAMFDEMKNASIESPVLVGTFPLTWERISPAELEQEHNPADDGNEITLRYYYLLDERGHEPAEDRDEPAPELVRIEQRLNLVIELLGQVLSRSFDLPPAVPCVFNREFFEWSSEKLPSPGECIRLAVHLHAHYPKPLMLLGQVTQVVQNSGIQRVTVQLAPLSESVGGWLDRLIFRAHRRAVAQTRRHKPLR